MPRTRSLFSMSAWPGSWFVSICIVSIRRGLSFLSLLRCFYRSTCRSVWMDGWMDEAPSISSSIRSPTPVHPRVVWGLSILVLGSFPGGIPFRTPFPHPIGIDGEIGSPLLGPKDWRTFHPIPTSPCPPPAASTVASRTHVDGTGGGWPSAP